MCKQPDEPHTEPKHPAPRGRQERADIERYVQGYRECPETDAEIQAIHAAGQEALAQEPWD